MADLKQAMLSKNEMVRDTLRMVKTDLMNQEVALGRDLSDDETTATLRKAVKSRQDSVQQYEAGNRPEAAEKERAEIAVIEGYLPKLLDAATTRASAEAIVKELGLSLSRDLGPKDMGRAMGELKKRHGALLDGKLASTILKQLLTQTG